MCGGNGIDLSVNNKLKEEVTGWMNQLRRRWVHKVWPRVDADVAVELVFRYESVRGPNLRPESVIGNVSLVVLLGEVRYQSLQKCGDTHRPIVARGGEQEG